MKSHPLIILAGVIGFSSHLASGQNKVIKSIKTESFVITGNHDPDDSVYDNGDTAFVLISMEEFNERGEPLSILELRSIGSKKSEMEWIYNAKGRLQKHVTVDYYGKGDRLDLNYYYEYSDSLSRTEIIDNGELFLTIIIKRDSTGNILSRTTFSDRKERNVFKYFYASDGKLIRIQKFDESGEYAATEKRFNQQGLLVEEINVGEDLGWSCPDTCHNFYFYDSIGNLILAKYNWESDSSYTEIINTYHTNREVKETQRRWKGCIRCTLDIDRFDTYGNLISREFIRDFDDSKRSWYYSYEYDYFGNWIIKIEINDNGATNGTKRTIEYY